MLLDVLGQGGFAFVRRTARTAADSNTGGSAWLWAANGAQGIQVTAGHGRL
jgi:hypothetical protein